MCSGKLESHESFVRIAAAEIQVRARLDNSNKIKFMVIFYTYMHISMSKYFINSNCDKFL